MNRLLILLLLTFCLTGSTAAEAFVTTTGGETITWDFDGIPTQNFWIPDPACGYRADTNFYYCNYGLIDVPYGEEITFTASLDPVSPKYPTFSFGYYDIYGIPHPVVNKSYVYPSHMDIGLSFFIPASAKTFYLIYHSDSGADSQVNIQLDFTIANYDPVRANLLGGEDINPDTEYCDDRAQPGEPRIRKFKNKKGSGPGS